LLGRKNLCKNYKSVGNSRERRGKIEIHSAALPEIGTAISIFKKNSLVIEKIKEKKMEYIHEEFYDTQSKQKWTIFNKHALEVLENDEET
jgi:hypothetical protein